MSHIKLPVLIGLLTSLSVVLGVLENFIPLPLPAIRLGLANLPIMIILFFAPVRYAVLLMLLKSILVPIFSGNFIFKISLGFPSTVMAFIGMVIVFKLLKSRTTAISIGVTAAFFHMLTQLVVADFLYIHGIMTTNIVGILLLIATVTGVLTGVFTNVLVNNKVITSLFDVQR